MDATHFHLLLNHFPIIGSLIGTVILIWGIARKQDNVKAIASSIIIVMAIFAIPVFLTGEPAEETVENLPGVAESLIEEHEEAAELAIWVLGAAGLMAFLSLIVHKIRHQVANLAFTITMIISLLGFGAMARTGYTGGQIRHTELRSGAVVQGEKGAINEAQDAGERGGGGKEEDDD